MEGDSHLAIYGLLNLIKYGIYSHMWSTSFLNYISSFTLNHNPEEGNGISTLDMR